MIKRMIIMLVAVGLVLGAVYGFQVLKTNLIAKALSDYAAAPQTVSTIKVAPQSWQPTLKAIGTLRASQGVDVSPEIPGIVETITFESGQDVAAGTTLLQLRANDGPSRLKQLQAMADLADITYQRDLRQFRDKVVSQATVDADLANLKSARAQVEAQQALLDEKTVRAPFAGRLGIRQVDTGQYLNPGTAIVTLQALDPMYVDFFMPQQTLGQLALRQPVTVAVDGFPGQSFTGAISAINARVDTGTRNVQVRAAIGNPKSALLPGMYATVEVVTGAPQSLLTIPQAAITFNAYGSTVYVVEDHAKDAAGKPKRLVHQTFIKTGATRGDQIAVLSGLTEGQSIVTAGQLKLYNDAAVVIDNSVQPSSSATPTLPAR